MAGAPGEVEDDGAPRRPRRLEPLRARPVGPGEGHEAHEVIDLRPAPSWPGHDRPRLLVVDDEPDIRAWLRIAMGEEGWLVNGARSVEEALEMTARLRPDLVLLDHRLPDGNGIDCGRHLRDRHPRLRMVMFSAHLDLRVEEAAAGLGMATISKVDRVSLFATIAAHRDAIVEARATAP